MLISVFTLEGVLTGSSLFIMFITSGFICASRTRLFRYINTLNGANWGLPYSSPAR
jgi:hypothetical protein